ncbi:hypothetical protein HGA88_02135 [Candidatus Roizmanbacteria bacterium]|nr:hypothetical protein [Candidatus Roizmanbacteria bacterium]
MTHKMLFINIILVFFITIILDLLHKYFFQNQLNFIFFTVWFTIIIAIITTTISYTPFPIISKLIQGMKKEWKTLLGILILASVTRFFLLGVYPFVTTGDELRDAGLNGLYLQLGVTKDVFGFGSYDGYGNFIPLIAQLMSLITGSTSLSYLIPSALVGIASICVTYVLGRLLGGKTVGMIATLLLIASLSHLHYSRTELLVIMDSLLSVGLLLTAWFAVRNKIGFFLLGILAGFCFHFYAGIRGMLFAIVIYFLCLFLYQFSTLTFQKKLSLLHVKKIFLICVLIFTGIIIGLGPTINSLSNNILFNRVGTTTPLFHNSPFLQKSVSEKIAHVSELAHKSFFVYTFENTSTHFPYKAPLLAFPINWLFLFGVSALILREKFTRNKLSFLILIAIFSIPFTNEVLVNHVGADHRLMSTVPIITVVAAFGLDALTKRISSIYRTPILALFLIIFMALQFYAYFVNRLSDLDYEKTGTKEYTLQMMLKTAKEQSQYEKTYIINNHPHNYDFMHYQEKIEFLLYPQKGQVISKEEFLEKLASRSLEKGMNSLVLFEHPISDLIPYAKLHTFSCYENYLLPHYFCPIATKQPYSFYSMSTSDYYRDSK